jgi:hypothetical protein
VIGPVRCLLLALALLALPGQGRAASDCLPWFASERLQLNCLTQQLQQRQGGFRTLARADFLLASQGYRNRFGIVPPPRNPSLNSSVFPVLQYSTNINGGNPAGDLVLGEIVFTPDPDFVEQDGVLLGFGTSLRSRLRYGEGRFVDLNAYGSLAKDPASGLDVATLEADVCSRNHVRNWWYVDLCATTQNIYRDLSDDLESSLSLGLAKVFAGPRGSSHEAAVTALRIFSDGYEQNQIGLRLSSIHPNGLFTSVGLRSGAAVPDTLVPQSLVSIAVGRVIWGKPVTLFAGYQVSDGGRLLGFDQRDEDRYFGINVMITSKVTLYASYTATDSSIDYFDGSEPTVGIQFNGFQF